MSSGCRRRYHHGSSRSLVRRIGSSLPLSTGRRLYVQLPHQGIGSEGDLRNAALSERYDPNLEGLTLASYLKEPGQIISKAVGLFGLDPIEEEGEVLEEGMGVSSFGEAEEEVFMSESVDGVEGDKNEATSKRISALESELARLKAQIAVYALSESQEQSEVPAAPPPPAVPPPPLITALNTSTPAQPKATPLSDSNDQQQPLSHQVYATPRPDMAAALQDIGSVKLRSVAKSPGGTPLRRVHNNQEPAANDPAAIIAQALRKKFSHRVFQDSPDKENLDRSDASLTAGVGSPSVKLFD